MTQCITKCVRDYKVCQGRLQSVMGLQSMAVHTTATATADIATTGTAKV